MAKYFHKINRITNIYIILCLCMVTPTGMAMVAGLYFGNCLHCIFASSCWQLHWRIITRDISIIVCTVVDNLPGSMIISCQWAPKIMAPMFSPCLSHNRSVHIIVNCFCSLRFLNKNKTVASYKYVQCSVCMFNMLNFGGTLISVSAWVITVSRNN